MYVNSNAFDILAFLLGLELSEVLLYPIKFGQIGVAPSVVYSSH
jgi:hypothetical protein